MRKSTTKVIVNWELFRLNSSSSETIWEISEGDITNWKQWRSLCWPKDCKAEIDRLKKLILFKDLRRRARSYSTRHFT